MRRVIVVIGEALIDLLVRPDGRVEAAPGGGPFNTARTIARLGQPAAFAGRLSTDAFGRRLRDVLAADGVDLQLVESTDDPTTLAVVEAGIDGAADYRFHLDGTSAPGLGPALLERLGRPRALHLGTLGLVLEPLGSTVERAVERVPPETLVMLDLNARPAALPDGVGRAAWTRRVERLLERVDVMKASVDDLDWFRPRMATHAAAASIVAAGTVAVLLTDGAAPVRIVTADWTRDVEPPRVEVVDTIGAGDAFGGAFLARWIGEGRVREDLEDADAVVDATRLAVRVASVTCTRAGADPPAAAELEGGSDRQPVRGMQADRAGL
jgi:fructokinase